MSGSTEHIVGILVLRENERSNLTRKIAEILGLSIGTVTQGRLNRARKQLRTTIEEIQAAPFGRSGNLLSQEPDAFVT